MRTPYRIHADRTAGLVVLLVCLSAAVSPAADLKITVKAGARARGPIRVAVTLPETLSEAREATVEAGDGRQWIAQITRPSLLSDGSPASPGFVARELHWIHDELPDGESVTLTATIGSAPKSGRFAWHDTPGVYKELQFDGRPVLRYMYRKLDESTAESREETYKVFHHLYDPSGKQIITKGPGGLYTHHRGLFYGFNRISYGSGKQADIWHCRMGEDQSHAAHVEEEAGPVLGRHRLAIDWTGRDGKVFAKETREMTVYNCPAGTLVEFASALRSLVGKIVLDGDPQHAGFQFRASNEVADRTKGQTYYLRTDGRGALGETRNWDHKKPQSDQNAECTNRPWNAMSFVVGGQRLTAAYLDKPTNPKPARYSERDYGRFGCYFPYELNSDAPLRANYRVWLQEGEMTVQQVAALSAGFVDPAVVRVD